MKRNFIQIINLWTITIALVSASIINITANLAGQNIADSLSSIILYGTTFLSFLCIINHIPQMHSLWYALITIGGMAIFQKYIVQPLDQELYNNFFIHGIGALIIGYSITQYKRLISIVSILALGLCIILFFEPITHSYMNLGNMSTGYVMAPLTIWLFTQYFITPNKKYLLVVAIPISLLIIFFCSRGCGLSIITAVILLKFWNNHLIGIKTTKFLKWIFSFGIIGYIIFNVFVDYISTHSELINGESSFIARIIHGGANESSGRDMIWNTAIEMLDRYFFTGLGIGNDRPMIYSLFGVEYVHNIILEVLLNYGVVTGLFLIYAFCRSCYKSILKTYDKYYGYLLIALISMYIVRLLFSGSYLSSSFEIFLIIGVVTRSLDISRIYKRNHAISKHE